MSREEDRTLFADIFEPFDRAINNDSKIKSQPIKNIFSERSKNEVFKRNSSLGSDQATTPKRKRLNSNAETSKTSPVIASPWETNRLKGELIEAKAQINILEQRIDHQRRIGKEMTVLFESEKETLISQQKRDELTISKLENHLKFIREREADVKKKLSELTKQMAVSCNEAESRVQQLQKENASFKEKIIYLNAENQGQISEMKKDMYELSQALEAAQLESAALRKELNTQLTVEKDVQTLKNKLDTQTCELLILNNRIKELEHEQESNKEMIARVKMSEKMLSSVPELERELARMQKEEKHLRENARGKLLMEEKLNTLKQKLTTLEPTQKELHEVKVKNASLETALSEWQEVLKLVVPVAIEDDGKDGWEKMRGGAGARLVKYALEKAQHAEVSSVSDKIEAESKVVHLKNELCTMKHEWEKTKTKLESLEKLQQVQKGLLHRLQKRLSLVARERDSYRNQLDCYEKELTVTITAEGQSGNPLQVRVDGLEKTIQGYRELLDKMDKDSGILEIEAAPALRDQVSHLREEIETLRCDNEKLRTRKNQLELQLEYRALKGDYDPSKYKILHIANNPASVAQSNVQTDLEKAELEIKHLRQKIKKLQAEGVDMSQRLAETTMDGSNSKEVQQIRQELEGSKLKLQRMKEVFTTSSKEFRDVCYLLLGYKIDRVGQQYKLTNMYAESPDEYLNFTLTDGEIEMVQTNYSMTIGDLVELHLHQHRSLPLFLSALTMQLFSKTTMMQEDEEEEEEDGDDDDDDDEDDDDDDDDEE